MDPALIVAGGSILANLAQGFVIFSSRRSAVEKAVAEAGKIEAEEGAISVETATAVVSLVREQLGAMTETLGAMQQELDQRKNAEANLRMQIGKLRRRILVLEGIITASGLELPYEEEPLG